MRTRRKLCPNEFTINFLPHNIRSLSHKYIHTLLLFDQHRVTFTGAGAAPAAAAGWMGCLSRRRQLITCLFAPSSDKIKCKLRCPLLSSLSLSLCLFLCQLLHGAGHPLEQHIFHQIHPPTNVTVALEPSSGWWLLGPLKAQLLVVGSLPHTGNGMTVLRAISGVGCWLIYLIVGHPIETSNSRRVLMWNPSLGADKFERG